MSTAGVNEIVEHPSRMSFDATIEHLLTAIADAGLQLFCRIDHAAGARDAGLQMPSSTVLLYGHPKGGTPIMRAAPLAALDLPLRVLVRQKEDGTTVIAFHPVVAMLRHAGVAEELAARLAPAQQILVAAIG